jgi:hypothetical protein
MEVPMWFLQEGIKGQGIAHAYLCPPRWLEKVDMNLPVPSTNRKIEAKKEPKL